MGLFYKDDLVSVLSFSSTKDREYRHTRSRQDVRWHIARVTVVVNRGVVVHRNAAAADRHDEKKCNGEEKSTEG